MNIKQKTQGPKSIGQLIITSLCSYTMIKLLSLKSHKILVKLKRKSKDLKIHTQCFRVVHPLPIYTLRDKQLAN